VSQLQLAAVSNKKPKFGPKVATQAWWIENIRKDPNTPENIEITGQGDQTANQGAQVQDPSQQQGQSPAVAQGVYVGGTYPATLTRAAQGTPSYRPPQFAFTTPPVRPSCPSQEEFKSTKSHEGGDGFSSSETTKPLPTPRRIITFEALMRPLDVARTMYYYLPGVNSLLIPRLRSYLGER